MGLKSLFNWNCRDLFTFAGLLRRPTGDKMELVRNWYSEIAQARTG
jgi:hypothetical protein